jgi:hypothetical protein
MVWAVTSKCDGLQSGGSSKGRHGEMNIIQNLGCMKVDDFVLVPSVFVEHESGEVKCGALLRGALAPKSPSFRPGLSLWYHLAAGSPSPCAFKVDALVTDVQENQFQLMHIGCGLPGACCF